MRRDWRVVFAIKAEQQGTAFVADRRQAWREALCVIEERTVANDNTIAWSGRRLQLPESRLRPHFVKAVVRVHEYPDATVSVFLGPHRLATFAANGQLISPDAPQPGSVLACTDGVVQAPAPERLIKGGFNCDCHFAVRA